MPNALAARAWDLPVSFMYPSIQEIAQLFAAAGVAELAQRLGFDLADTLTGDIELLADLLQRAGAAVLKAEAQAQDLLLTRGQRCLLYTSRCV